MAKRKKKDEKLFIQGMYRVQIQNPDGKLVGDSGWCENTIVNEGFDDYLCRLIANTTDSKQISFVAIGTGTAPGAAHTDLDGEIEDTSASHTRKAVTVSVSDSKTVIFTATFASADNHISAQQTLRNIGLFHTSNSGTLFAGSTYPTSSVNTNQNVNVTYKIQFQSTT